LTRESNRKNEIGSLQPGKFADFAVLDGNPLQTEPEQITSLQVLATVLGGVPVHQSASLFPGR
jgi:predicted amidohydrolase YtcJ